ncbi:MAG TPA: glycosyltransferase [Chitinophagaceae bacterium]|jgi:glycosyltransferase involved in cell wall biosynthesis|nr:glycosyltransferase [Chitinophagaceae bacterium]
MKVAIVHDDLMRMGGAEKVALTFLKAFPEADFYTLCYKPDLTYEEFGNYKINTTWFQKFAFNEASMKMLFYPMGIWAMKSLNFEKYDLVLISTTFCAKYLRLPAKTILITYCHTPFRLAWYPETYQAIRTNLLIRFLMFRLVCPRLRVVDKKYALRTDYFIANSKVTLDRIQQVYSRNIPVSILNPPVDLSKFQKENSRKDYYLVVSRFQPYKKIDLVIEVFNHLKDKRLIIVGTGVLEKELQKMAVASNIEFKGSVSGKELAHLYANCKALIFPQVEDFGITPLEANASGRPVIAFGGGGVLETMIGYKDKQTPFTALFFENQTFASLSKAILFFEEIENEVDSDFIVENAQRFKESNFIATINERVLEQYKILSSRKTNDS